MMLPEPEQRAHDMIGFLVGELIKGWKAFLIAEQIQISKENKKSKIPAELSKIIQNSCLETSVIALAKITDSHKDAIHMNSLFSYAEANPSALPLLQRKKSPSRIIADYRERYVRFEPIFKKVHDQRDQLLAHLDKKLLRDANLHFSNPISEDELRDGFASLHTIIYAFADYLSDKADIPTYDKSLNHQIAQEFSVIAG